MDHTYFYSPELNVVGLEQYWYLVMQFICKYWILVNIFAG